MRLVRTARLILIVWALLPAFTSGCGKKTPPRKEPPTIRMVRVSWTGVTIKSAVVSEILKSLGYRPLEKIVSVQLVYKALAGQEADFFLGYWVPSMKIVAAPYIRSGQVEILGVNMPGAKFTLAVPSYVAAAGLRHFRDIARFRDKLEGEIYGIEEGNDGNIIIQKLIDGNLFGLGGFKLVPSSEAGMLARVKSSVQQKKWIVFLGWLPHQMNKNIQMTYLAGSTAATFGPNDGAAAVYTNARKGFRRDHPNVSRLLANLHFPIPMMNDIMDEVNNKKVAPVTAALRWLRAHPETLNRWLKGVKTYHGKDGLQAFKAYLAKR